MIQRRKHKALVAAMDAAQKGEGTADDYVKAAARLDDEDKSYGLALTKALDVEMSQRADGDGSFYGSVTCGDEKLAVYVYPPCDLWNGDIEPAYPELQDTNWQVLVGGTIVAQAAMITDLPALNLNEVPALQSLANSPSDDSFDI